MRASATQYAKTLYELTKDKDQSEIDAVVSNFLKDLNKNGRMKLAESIVEKFREIYNAENGIVEAEVASREELGEEVRTAVSAMVRAKYGAKEVVLNNIVDKNIKGGIVVRVGDEIMDATLNRQLKELKKTLSE